MPDHAAAAGVERVAFVGAGDVHHAVDHHRRVLDLRRIGHGKIHFGREARDVALVDLRQRAVAVAAGLAIVRGPVGLRGHDAIAIAGLAQQTELACRRCAAEVQHAFAHDLAFDRLAVGGLDLAA